MKRGLALFGVVANLVLVDAVLKELAAGYLKEAAAFSVIPGFFNLAYVENRGCAWGLFQGHVWPLAVFGVLALGFLVWKHASVFGTGRMAFWTECLLEAGIVGNLIDRLFRGFVIDFVDLYHGAYHFPCFNFADSCITVAAALLVLSSLKPRTRTANSSNGN